MRRQLAPRAEADLIDILRWSSTNFGAEARRRYEELIRCGLTMITIGDPPGARSAEDLGAGVRVCHLRHCRLDTSAAVIRPRHIIIYRRVTADLVLVLRVLHDAMDLPAHLSAGD